MSIIEKHRSSAPAKPKPAPAPAAAEQEKPSKADKTPKAEKAAVEKTAAKKSGSGKTGSKTKPSAGQKGGSSKKSAPEASSGSPLVFVPNGKESRMKDEQKMKTLKWNFQSPRTEHIDQLKEQLAPCISSDLHTSFFHDDPKKHIAALAMLTKVLCAYVHTRRYM